MNISDIIKQAREELGMTQEDLAERLEVSRQAVSKWELGASVPSPENLELLEGVLGVRFPQEPLEEESAPQPAAKGPLWNWKRVALLVLGVLVLVALLCNVLFIMVKSRTNVDAARPSQPWITGISFFDGDASPLQPDLGDGWNSFTAGERVLLAVEFQNGGEDSVTAVSLFLTPAGTETLDQREQLAVQAVADWREFALFAWDVPEDLMGHLEVVLECGGGQRVTETLNVTAVPSSSSPEAGLALNAMGIDAVEGDTGHYTLEAYGAPMAEVEWSSSDPAVARVTNTGTVFIEGAGEAVITASWNGQTAECPVSVHAKEDVKTAYGKPSLGEEGNTDLPQGVPGEQPGDRLSYEPPEERNGQ